jgi:hypothetical protein
VSKPSASAGKKEGGEKAMKIEPCSTVIPLLSLYKTR